MAREDVINTQWLLAEKVHHPRATATHKLHTQEGLAADRQAWVARALPKWTIKLTLRWGTQSLPVPVIPGSVLLICLWDHLVLTKLSKEDFKTLLIQLWRLKKKNLTPKMEWLCPRPQNKLSGRVQFGNALAPHHPSFLYIHSLIWENHKGKFIIKSYR